MKISLKKAQHADIPFLWYLRNQPDVYQHFKTPKPVSWEDHVAWIMPIVLSLKEKGLYVIAYDNVSAGQLRFDYENDSAEVSVSLLKELRGKGIAKTALKKGIAMIKRKGVKTLTAQIHQANPASLTLFEGIGFKRTDAREPYIHYQLSL